MQNLQTNQTATAGVLSFLIGNPSIVDTASGIARRLGKHGNEVEPILIEMLGKQVNFPDGTSKVLVLKDGGVFCLRKPPTAN